MDGQDPVSLTAAARALGVSEGTMRNWADRGILPCWRHPTRNARLFDRADVDALRAKLSGAHTQRKVS